MTCLRLLVLLCLFGLLNKGIYTKEIDERIYQGYYASYYGHGYLVLLYYMDLNGKYFICGGNFISDSDSYTQWLLTAAHCCTDVAFMDIYAGLTDINDGNGVLIYTVESEELIIHPDYNRQTLVNDICLIDLRKYGKIQFTDKINRCCLPPSNFDMDILIGKYVSVAGWGKTSDSSTGIAPILQITNVQCMDRKKCQTDMAMINEISDDMICTNRGDMKLTGPCKGDSGGALVYKNLSSPCPLCLGSVSYSSGGCATTKPCVYQSFLYHLAWIREVTNMYFP